MSIHNDSSNVHSNVHSTRWDSMVPSYQYPGSIAVAGTSATKIMTMLVDRCSAVSIVCLPVVRQD